ncbi:MAG: glycine C-acetyltransferase [Acidobacteria bacterium]|nr:glycine C-acetyltransferase [Acidobacteriota bacterium]MBV9475132.1 glycine C-acetyltransferase [Acidobacteriota bacterium]
MNTLLSTLSAELESMSSAGTLKRELPLKSAQGPLVEIEGLGEVIMLTSNNYLGLADHPAIVEAAEKAERDFGYGLASVRFICGTQTIHRQLEERIAEFFGTEDTILYGSCWNANEGLFQTVALEQDAIVSDELNHASIIDGIRLSKARKERFKNRDMGDLRRALEATKDTRNKVVMTDGVFSMEGSLAPLPEMIELTREYGAFLVVDESHGTGVLGATGRGTPEELGVFGKIDAYTSTLGKALGGSHGGFTTGPNVLVEYLRQKSRPYLFSNTLPPAVVLGSLAAIDLVDKDPSFVGRLRENTAYFRAQLTAKGVRVREGIHPIVPILIGDTAKAIAMSKELLTRGVYVSGFGFPVVPQGAARLRCQISAAHTREHLDRAIAAIVEVAAQFGVLESAA